MNVIGGFEAQAIAVGMKKMTPNRPLTHDLTKNIIEALGFTLQEVCIDALIDGIFYAKITLSNTDEQIEIDSRVSDVIALAVRFDAPIFTYPSVIAAAGVPPEKESKS